MFNFVVSVETAISRAQQMTELNDEEMRAALGLANLRPGGQSPLVSPYGEFLTPLDESAAGSALAGLSRKGVLTPSPVPRLRAEWAEALATLANPLWDLSMIVGRQGSMNYDRYFAKGPLDERSLVFYRAAPGGGSHHVSFPYGPNYVLDLLDQTIGFNTPAAPSDANTELNYKEYIVLTALVDLFRRRQLDGLMRRGLNERRDVSLDELRVMLEDGIRISDPRWLVSLGNTVSPFEFQMPSENLQGLLEALQLRGYVSAEAGGISATDQLLAMADSMLVLPAFAAFELTFIKSVDIFEINYFAAVRGIDGLWLFDFYELATSFPRVSLATVGGDELRLMLERLIEETQEKTEALLRSRRQTPAAASDSNRSPSPPTLRSLKVPSTVGSMGSNGQAAAPEIEMSEAPAVVQPGPPPPIAKSESETDVPTLRPAARAEAAEPAPAAVETPIPSQPTTAPPVTLPTPLVAESNASIAPPAPVSSAADSQTPVAERPAPAEPHAPAEPPAPIVDSTAAPPTVIIPAVAPAVAAPAEGPCPHCGLPVVVGKKFCRHCGKTLDAPMEKPRAAPPPASPVISQAPDAEPSQPLVVAAAVPPPAPPRPAAGGTLSCAVCGLALAETARFCGHCGANTTTIRQPPPAAAIERSCPSCQGKLAPNAKFCAFCGYRV